MSPAQFPCRWTDGTAVDERILDEYDLDNLDISTYGKCFVAGEHLSSNHMCKAQTPEANHHKRFILHTDVWNSG